VGLDPWHHVPVLARKPGVPRNGAPFKDWVLRASRERVRRKLAGVDDGNRQMVDILTDGLPAIEDGHRLRSIVQLPSTPQMRAEGHSASAAKRRVRLVSSDEFADGSSFGGYQLILPARAK
jgi:hypothetical protein